MSGQLSFSKPGALRSRSLSMSRTATFWERSKLSASQGMAKCRSPSPRKPPNERMAYATRLFLASRTMSSIVPRSSRWALMTFVPRIDFLTTMVKLLPLAALVALSHNFFFLLEMTKQSDHGQDTPARAASALEL